MDITYLGHSSFKISVASPSGVKTKTVIVTDPFDPSMVGLKYAGVEADIVTISHEHGDHNRADLVGGVKRVVKGPGEYEIAGVSIIGIPSFHDNNSGAERGKNTIYVFEADGLRLAHLGDLGHTLSEKEVSEIGDIDILMIPTGGEFTIGPKEAVGVVQAIEPFYVLPMHYLLPGLAPETFSKLSPVDAFLSEAGMTTERLPKFSIRKEDIQEDQATKIIVLERR